MFLFGGCFTEFLIFKMFIQRFKNAKTNIGSCTKYSLPRALEFQNYLYLQLLYLGRTGLCMFMVDAGI